jgi:hypothetical protein
MRAILVMAVLAAAACGPRRAAWKPSDAMERSAKLLNSLDKLEADLHAGTAETDVYATLVARHGHAQEIACKVTDEHVEEIHRLAALQQEKLRQKRAQRKKAIAQLRTGYSKS